MAQDTGLGLPRLGGASAGPGAAAARQEARRLGPWLRGGESDDSLKTSYSSSSRRQDPGSKGQSTHREWTRTAADGAYYAPAPHV